MSEQGPARKARQQILKGLALGDEVAVAISALSFGQSPRLMPTDVDHARMLAQTDQTLPPIVVHAETMTVIDGRHRVLAAQLRGETSIRACLFHGTEDEAFLLAVRANTTHGKPLTLAERLLAASRILATRPDISDRAIAGICGLSPHTVTDRCNADPTRDQTQRVGADGRTRPLSSQITRQQATALMLAFPHESNRKIARDVGLSEATVRDVRRQIKRAAEVLSKEGDNPVEPVSIGALFAGESKLRQSPASKAKRSDCTQCASPPVSRLSRIW